MKINWNFVDLMKRSRGEYVKDKEFQAFFKKIINLQSYKKILDVGCGIGTIPHLFYRIYKDSIEIYGIDLDPNLIKWGQTHWGKPHNINLLQGTVYDLNFPDDEFDIITSFGILEILETPLEALDEMIRVNKRDGKFITLTLEKSRREIYPIREVDSYLYQEFLAGLRKSGFPIENEGKHIQEVFLKRGIRTKHHEYCFESKGIITEKLIELWERGFTDQTYKKFVLSSMDFYYQFLREVGWTREKFLKFVENYSSVKKMTDFYREYLGEEMIQRLFMVILIG